ncbi:4-hydroxy-tetrahydrodipicolinate reductase [uncultured Treponema sp.]|uniref:4-hydroxy-tetrahydrodipicolinate reductase n=1 Tax=uncultured Treponema sp. TaxID=162155 RepID=UPI0026111F94|nr:4-hydroxy-tetrahydrodipicolinate reductase [uncultured Treponema sp.]
MKIALVGYGKMGHMIKNCALSLGHEVVATIDVISDDADIKVSAGDGQAVARAVKSSGADGVIEFSHPTAVLGNINALLPLGIPIVVGTTGWNSKFDEVSKLASDCGGTIMTSSNFSIGVNMLYKIIEEAVKIMEPWQEYDISTWEMHHNQKADSPSGTALEIAKRILKNTNKKTEMVVDAFHEKPKPEQLHVSSTRCGAVPGTHTVFFDSPADTIEITHTARSREGFALGAVHALERLCDGLKTGRLVKGKLYGMQDLF